MDTNRERSSKNPLLRGWGNSPQRTPRSARPGVPGPQATSDGINCSVLWRLPELRSDGLQGVPDRGPRVGNGPHQVYLGLIVGLGVEQPYCGVELEVSPCETRPKVLHSHGPAAIFGHKRDHSLRARKRPRYSRGLFASLWLVVCTSYLTPTTCLTFSVRGFFSSCSLLRRSWSSWRWRASSSISLLSVILRASFSSS